MLQCSSNSELLLRLGKFKFFNDPLSMLGNQFVKPAHVIYTRYELITKKQKAGNSINYFLGRRNQLVEKCNCHATTASSSVVLYQTKLSA